MCCDVLCVDSLGFCVALEHSANIEIAAHGLRHNKLCPPPITQKLECVFMCMYSEELCGFPRNRQVAVPYGCSTYLLLQPCSEDYPNK